MTNPIDSIFTKTWAENGRSDSVAEQAVGFVKWLINGAPETDDPGDFNPTSAKRNIQNRSQEIDRQVNR